MAPRANWKGFLKVAELSCPVALYTAASTSDRIAFHTINRATGHRVRREFVDSETGKPVASDAQVKGYEVGSGDYVDPRAGRGRGRPARQRQDAVGRHVSPMQQHRRRLFRQALFPGTRRQARRGGVRPDPRRHEGGQGGGAGVDRALPTCEDGSHTAAWRRTYRHDAQLRLRGPVGKGRVFGDRRPEDQGRDARSRQAHHLHQEGQVRSVLLRGSLRGRARRTRQGQGRRPADRQAEGAGARQGGRPDGGAARKRRRGEP